MMIQSAFSMIALFFFVVHMHAMDVLELLFQPLNRQTHVEETINPFDSETCIVTVPGQNGLGDDLCGVFNMNHLISADINKINSGTAESDLGQDRCIAHFEKTINAVLSDQKIKKVIVFAASQGTATVDNYLVRENKKGTDLSKIKLIVLEAMLPSGNSVIYHTVKSTMIRWIDFVPGLYYVLPYFYTLLSGGSYQPAGKQPILSVDTLPCIPTIFLHGTGDIQCSYDDALRFYGAVKKHNVKQSKNTYFISFLQDAHVCLFNSCNDEEKAKLNPLFNYIVTIELKKLHDDQFHKKTKIVRPEVEEKDIEEFINREKRFKYIDPVVKVSFLLCVSWCTYVILMKIYKNALWLLC